MIPREDHFPRVEQSVARLLEAEGLRLFGVATTGPPDADAADWTDPGRYRSPDRARAEYDEWIDRGHHGAMDYLERHAPMKYDPTAVMGGCRSVVVVGCNYFQQPARHDRAAADAPAPGAAVDAHGRIARYAWGRDYHNALGKRLKRVVRSLRDRYPDEQFRSFVDASPLSERHLASRAGVGYTARNTLTISSAYGSWFFLGEILTTLELESTSADEPLHGGCPSSCFRCGNICPTDALYDHYRIDARRCISYLTIEYRGSVPIELRPLMGDWVFGCDLCQEVCPLNVRAKETGVDDFRAHRAGERISLRELLTIADDASYRDRFAGTPLLRPGRDAMVRNAAIAAANTRAVELMPILRTLVHDPSPVVRETSRWALERLGLHGV